MHMKAFSLIFLFVFIVSGKSYAESKESLPYDCVNASDGSYLALLYGFGEVIKMHSTDPAGTIIWRSYENTFEYKCWRADSGYNTSYQINPLSRDLGPDVALGVTIDGKDYILSKSKKYVAHYIDKKGPGLSDSVVKRFKASAFMVKVSPAISIKESRSINVSGMHTLFSSGSGKLGSKIYTLGLGPLGEVKVTTCTSTVMINPSTIDFGRISVSDAVPQREIKRASFTISEQRACETPSIYGLNGYLQPAADAELSENLKTLVPLNTNTVGINIVDAASGNIIPFGQEFVITNVVGTANNSRQFEARLKWLASPAKPGAFNAGAMLDVYYK
ncbi:fimbrial protein [Pseudomonas protegens]|uniref:fimbrial protein n=1 Tax=Pseudomonas protegens TaxID=380021 RepID=UPI00390622C2